MRLLRFFLALVSGLFLVDLAVDVACAAGPPAHPSPATPTGRPGDWISDNDYPTTALRSNTSGVVRFALTIDATGTPSGCEITATSNDAELDQATCDLLLKRARFKPATDATGKPARGRFSSSVRWQIPKTLVAVPQPFKLTASFDILPDGKRANCIESSEGSPPKEVAQNPGSLCGIHGKEFEPPTDASGRPVKKHLEVVVITTVADVP